MATIKTEIAAIAPNNMIGRLRARPIKVFADGGVVWSSSVDIAETAVAVSDSYRTEEVLELDRSSVPPEAMRTPQT